MIFTGYNRILKSIKSQCNSQPITSHFPSHQPVTKSISSHRSVTQPIPQYYSSLAQLFLHQPYQQQNYQPHFIPSYPTQIYHTENMTHGRQLNVPSIPPVYNISCILPFQIYLYSSETQTDKPTSNIVQGKYAQKAYTTIPIRPSSHNPQTQYINSTSPAN